MIRPLLALLFVLAGCAAGDSVAPDQPTAPSPPDQPVLRQQPVGPSLPVPGRASEWDEDDDGPVNRP
jgi:hypothetical protein